MTVEFVVLMGVAAVQGFWPGGGPGRGLALVFLAASAIVMPVVMARMAAPIFRDVDRLTQERDRLEDLYGQAREDSLLDGLTGLGNHRAFQEELPASSSSRRARESIARRCCWWTSTTSRRSTMSAATPPATTCLPRSAGSR